MAKGNRGTLDNRLSVLIFGLIWLAFSIPVVEWSWTTLECVRVIPPEAGTCDDLPKRYERVWVR